MAKPIIALVGRPNVGKSTLFNRLAQERLAVVDDIPGTTRDRLVTEAEWAGFAFDIVDTGGIDPTQTGPGKQQQPLSTGSAEFIQEIRKQAEIAISEADAVLFITDVESGVTPADQEVAQILRRHQKEREGKPWPPVILVVNTPLNCQPLIMAWVTSMDSLPCQAPTSRRGLSWSGRSGSRTWCPPSAI